MSTVKINKQAPSWKRIKNNFNATSTDDLLIKIYAEYKKQKAESNELAKKVEKLEKYKKAVRHCGTCTDIVDGVSECECGICVDNTDMSVLGD